MKLTHWTLLIAVLMSVSIAIGADKDFTVVSAIERDGCLFTGDASNEVRHVAISETVNVTTNVTETHPTITKSERVIPEGQQDASLYIRHWKEKGALPIASTVNVADISAVTMVLAGWLTTTGGPEERPPRLITARPLLPSPT